MKEWRKRWYRWSKRRWSTRQRPRRRLVKRDAGSCGQAPVAAGGRRGAVRGGGEIRRVLRGADPEVGHAELWAPPRSTVPKAQPREDRANWTRGDRKARVGQTAERHTAEQFAGSRRSRRSDRVVEGASVGCASPVAGGRRSTGRARSTRRVLADAGRGRAARPGRNRTASPSSTGGWTPATARSGSPTLLIEVENDRSRVQRPLPAAQREAGRPRGGVRAARRDPRPRQQPRPLCHGEGHARHRLQAAQVRQRLAVRRGEPAGCARPHRPRHPALRCRRPLGQRHDIGQRQAALRHAAQVDLQHAVCASSGKMFLAETVVETRDRIVGRTYRESRPPAKRSLGTRRTAVRESLRGFAEQGSALIGAGHGRGPRLGDRDPARMGRSRRPCREGGPRLRARPCRVHGIASGGATAGYAELRRMTRRTDSA